MKADKVILVDYRTEIGKEKVQEALLKIKPLSKYDNEEKVPLEKIEKLLFQIQKKYKAGMAIICVSGKANDESLVYTGGIADDEGKVICAIHGIEVYELLAKTAIKLWDLKQEGKIERRK